ncbi:MAG: hypothetical protein AAFP86_10185, partial [Planctomycetota bacterium]
EVTDLATDALQRLENQTQGTQLGALGEFAETPFASGLQELIDFEAQVNELDQAIAALDDALAPQSGQALSLDQLAQFEDRREQLQRQRQQLVNAETAALEQQLATLRQITALETAQLARRTRFNLDAASRTLAAERTGNSLEIAAVEQQIQLESDANDLLDERERLLRSIADQEAQLATLSARTLSGRGSVNGFAEGVTQGVSEIESLRRQLEQNGIEVERNTLAQQELSRSLTFGGGASRAVDALRTDTSPGVVGERTVGGALDIGRRLPTQIFSEAIRSGVQDSEAQFETIFANAGLQLAETAFQGLIDTLIQGAFFETTNTAALGTNTAALLANTAALGASAVTSGLGALGGLGGAATGAVSGPGISFIGRAEGGPLPASAPSLATAPPGFDSRDTIPTLMRAGEYVVTPEMLGGNPGLFSMLESMRAGGRGFRLQASTAFMDAFKGVRGMADGGPVLSTTAPRVSSGGGATRVVPALVLTPREMRRIGSAPQLIDGLTRRSQRALGRRQR